MRLHGARTLLTGASGGLGEAIARELASRGAQLVLTGRREQDLARLADELGGRARWLAADLRSLDGVRELLDAAGEVDVLIANAGVPISEPLSEVGDEELQVAVQVNLLAPLGLARGVIEPMVARGSGHIVFMSSVAGLVGTSANGPVYTATKWGLRGLGLALRQELHGTGVAVSTIFPGPVREAGMFARTGVELPRSAGSSSPAEVASAVVRAIEQDRAEITVAAGSVRLSAALSGVAPVLVGHAARRAGAGEVRRKMLAARRGAADE